MAGNGGGWGPLPPQDGDSDGDDPWGDEWTVPPDPIPPWDNLLRSINAALGVVATVRGEFLAFPSPDGPVVFTGGADPLLPNAPMLALADKVVLYAFPCGEILRDHRFMVALCREQERVCGRAVLMTIRYVAAHRAMFGLPLRHGFVRHTFYSGTIPYPVLARPDGPWAGADPDVNHRAAPGLRLRPYETWASLEFRQVHEDTLPLVSGVRADWDVHGHDFSYRAELPTPDEDQWGPRVCYASHGAVIALPEGAPALGSVIFSTLAPNTYVTTAMLDANRPNVAYRRCLGGPRVCILHDGTERLCHFEVPRLDVHFIDTPDPLAAHNYWDGRLRHRVSLHKVLVVESAPADPSAASTSAAAASTVPFVYACIGNDVLDATIFSAHRIVPGAKRRGELPIRRFQQDGVKNVLQLCPANLPGQCFLFPMRNFAISELPKGLSSRTLTMLRDPEEYYKRLGAVICYTGLPYRYGSHSVLAEVDLIEYRSANRLYLKPPEEGQPPHNQDYIVEAQRRFDDGMDLFVTDNMMVGWFSHHNSLYAHLLPLRTPSRPSDVVPPHGLVAEGMRHLGHQYLDDGRTHQRLLPFCRWSYRDLYLAAAEGRV
jgi:hypothetical protein